MTPKSNLRDGLCDSYAMDIEGWFMDHEGTGKDSLTGPFLIIKPGAIGDVLQMTPVARAIKEKSPGAQVFFLVGSQVTGGLLSNNPHVDSIFCFEKGRGIGEWRRVWSFAKRLRGQGIAVVLNYQPSNWRWRFLTSLLSPQRAILYKKQRSKRNGERVLHAVEDHLAALASLGIRSADCHMDFFPLHEELEDARGILAPLLHGGGVIGFNIGASHAVNRWPVSCFYRLDGFAAGLGFKTVLIGGEEDRGLAEEFFRYGASNALNLVGLLSIRQIGAVIKMLDILVSADTGPLHLATAVGTRVIALFGPSDPQRTGPLGNGHHITLQPALPCVPCRSRSCRLRKRICMESISPEELVSYIKGMISGGEGVKKGER